MKLEGICQDCMYLEKVKPLFDEKDKEIERLNNIIKEYEVNTIPTLEHNIDVLVDSEDRLNNIINELEKMLENPYNVDCINQNKVFLNKLQELKEGK